MLIEKVALEMGIWPANFICLKIFSKDSVLDLAGPLVPWQAKQQDSLGRGVYAWEQRGGKPFPVGVAILISQYINIFNQEKFMHKTKMAKYKHICLNFLGFIY